MADVALTAASGTITVPAGIFSALVRTIGEGGNGFNSASAAGGAYAESLIAVTPGDVLSWQVGQGGTGNDTWFVSTATVLAKAGPSATAFNAGGIAPAATSSIGQTRFKGGNGRSNGNVYGGYGGGGAAGPNGDGAIGGSSGGHGGGGGGGANAGAVGGTGASGTGGTGGNGRGATGGGTGGSGSGVNGADATAGTGAGGGGGSGHTSDTAVPSNGGKGAQENLWVVDGLNYGPGGGGGGGTGTANPGGGNGGGYGGGGGATGRDQSPNAKAGSGAPGLIILDWFTTGLQTPRNYAVLIGA